MTSATSTPDAPAGEGAQLTAEDAEVSELLLGLVRLARKPKHSSQLPAQLKELFESGYLARRHLTAFVVISLYGPLTVSELAAREGLAVSTASLLVTQLAEAGAVERREDADDRRRTVVSVAPSHRAESRQVLIDHLAPMRRAVARLGPERTAILLESLGILAEEISRDDDDPTVPS